MVGGGAVAKSVSTMGEVAVSWMLVGLVSDFSEKEVCLKDLLQMETT